MNFCRNGYLPSDVSSDASLGTAELSRVAAVERAKSFVRQPCARFDGTVNFSIFISYFNVEFYFENRGEGLFRVRTLADGDLLTEKSMILKRSMGGRAFRTFDFDVCGVDKKFFRAAKRPDVLF